MANLAMSNITLEMLSLNNLPVCILKMESHLSVHQGGYRGPSNPAFPQAQVSVHVVVHSSLRTLDMLLQTGGCQCQEVMVSLTATYMNQQNGEVPAVLKWDR